MSNFLFKEGKEQFLNGGIDMTADTIKVTLIDTGVWTVDNDSDRNLSDVPGGARISTVTLGTKTITDGVFDAADPTFTSVTGNTVEAFIIYKDSGVESTSPLIAYVDTVSSGLPFTPNGGDVVLTISAGAFGIFAL